MGLGSEIWDPEVTYSGSRTQGSKWHRIPDPDPQHCSTSVYNLLFYTASAKNIIKQKIYLIKRKKEM